MLNKTFTLLSFMGYSVQKILVPLDGSMNSKKSLSAAIYHAKQSDAKIVGLSVTPPAAKGLSYVPSYTKQDMINSKKILNDAEKISEKNDVSFKGKILHGNVGKEIVAFAKKNKIDLIVIGARGMGSVKEMFLGSVSHYVSHTSPIPILIVK